jgi:hypothetical protein
MDVGTDPLEALRRTTELSSARQRPVRIGPRRRDLLFPWLVALAIALPTMVVLDGLERAVAASAAGALSIGAVFAVAVATQQERRYRALHQTSRDAHAAEAHGRVVALRRQFEWTVDDLALTRKQLRVAELQKTYAATENAELREAIDHRDREIGRLRHELIELASLDIAELRRAREEADRLRAQAEARAQRAFADARRMERELRDAQARSDELTSVFAAIGAATTTAKVAAERSTEGASWWQMDTGGLFRVESPGDYQVVTALRVRGADGSVIARVPVRGHKGGAVRIRLPNEAAAALTAGGGCLEALVDDRWAPVGRPDAPRPQRDRAPGRPRHLRVVGG